jgi:antitoxin PrlF
MASKITSKGQVTIPKAMRDHLGVKEGDEVEFIYDQDGSVQIRKRVNPAAMAKALREARKHIVLDMTADEYLKLTRGEDWNKVTRAVPKPRPKAKTRPSRKGRAA